MTAGQRFAVTLVRGYQLLLAPFSGGACRFEPSCSAYAMEAIEIHGAVRGLWLAVRRVLRCHPFSTAGIDPVPAALDQQPAGRPSLPASRSEVG
jgi:putative membrane protein insertion efficiency factor